LASPQNFETSFGYFFSGAIARKILDHAPDPKGLAGFVQTLESPGIKMLISRPGKSWKKAQVLENSGKVLEF